MARLALRGDVDEGYNSLPRTELAVARWDPNAPARAALLHTDGTLRVWDGPTDSERVYDILVGALTLPGSDGSSASTVRRLRGPWQDVQWVPGRPGDIIIRQKHSNKVFLSHLPDFDALVQGYAGGEDLISVDHDDRVTCIAVHPEGRSVLVGELSGSVRLWTLSSLNASDGDDVFVQPEAHGGAVLALDVVAGARANSLICVSAGADNVLRVWDGETGGAIAWVPLSDVPSCIRVVREAPSTQHLIVVGSESGSICCWRGRAETTAEEGAAAAKTSWRLVQIIDHSREPIASTSCAEIAAGVGGDAARLLATASNDGFVRVYSAAAAGGGRAPTWRRVRDFEFESPVVACCFHAESDVGTVLCACADGSTRIWSICESGSAPVPIEAAAADADAAAPPAAVHVNRSGSVSIDVAAQQRRAEEGGAPRPPAAGAPASSASRSAEVGSGERPISPPPDAPPPSPPAAADGDAPRPRLSPPQPSARSPSPESQSSRGDRRRAAAAKPRIRGPVPMKGEFSFYLPLHSTRIMLTI